MSEIGHHSTPKSRRDRRCMECGGTIHRGDIYHRYDGLYDGSSHTWWHCDSCEQWWAVVEAAGLPRYDRYEGDQLQLAEQLRELPEPFLSTCCGVPRRGGGDRWWMGARCSKCGQFEQRGGDQA